MKVPEPVAVLLLGGTSFVPLRFAVNTCVPEIEHTGVLVGVGVVIDVLVDVLVDVLIDVDVLVAAIVGVPGVGVGPTPQGLEEIFRV